MKRTVPTCLMIFLGFATTIRAELPWQTPAELRAKASHIVTGDVKLICSEVTKDDEWAKTVGVVEIRVVKLEKGDKIEPGDSVYARFWTQAWIGKGSPPPSASGHELPKKGESVRVYLERKDGGYEALLPNGFESSPRATTPKAKP